MTEYDQFDVDNVRYTPAPRTETIVTSKTTVRSLCKCNVSGFTIAQGARLHFHKPRSDKRLGSVIIFLS